MDVDTFKWTGRDNCFMWSGEEKIAMGGGKDGFAFILDKDFSTGETCESETFGNPKLVRNHTGSSFRIMDVECWGFKYF